MAGTGGDRGEPVSCKGQATVRDAEEVHVRRILDSEHPHESQGILSFAVDQANMLECKVRLLEQVGLELPTCVLLKLFASGRAEFVKCLEVREDLGRRSS